MAKSSKIADLTAAGDAQRAAAASKAIDNLVNELAVEKKRYRVIRPILHGNVLLTAGDFVDVDPAAALHLVESKALELFIVKPTPTGAVLELATPATPVTTQTFVSAAQVLAGVQKVVAVVADGEGGPSGSGEPPAVEV